jgi:hypothetical protein
MKYLSKMQSEQLSTILLLALVILGVVFALKNFGILEGFAKSAEQYVSGVGPFVYSVNDLKEMAGGKTKLAGIQFYDYFEKKDAKGKILQKGFILQDDPKVGMQNETGGPKITFGNNKVVYASNSTRSPKFPIDLTDSNIASGIKISNIAGNLGGDVQSPLSTCTMTTNRGVTSERCVAKVQFNRNDKATEEPGKGKETKIVFVFE